MSVEHSTAMLQGVLKGLGASLFIPGGSSFADSLSLGQIIKGKVLRHYGGDRYLVSFSGQDRVVDSAVPLQTRELIYGKVVGLGERVELHRVSSQRPENQVDQVRTQNNTALGFGKSEALVDKIFHQHNAKLEAADKNTLLRSVKTSSEPGFMALVGLLLNKLSVGQSTELLNAIYGRLSAKNANQFGLFPLANYVPHLGVESRNTSEGRDRAIQELAVVIAQQLDEMPEKKLKPTPARHTPDDTTAESASEQLAVSADSGDGEHKGSSWSDMHDVAHWVLNGQTNGAVAHRVATLSFWLNDQLVELDVAIFDQKKGAQRHGESRYRQLVFSLTTANLGNIELVVNIADAHVRLRVVTDEPSKADILATYMDDLRAGLRGAGWEVDEMRYEHREKDGRGQVVHSLVDHLISQDSLSRLM